MKARAGQQMWMCVVGLQHRWCPLFASTGTSAGRLPAPLVLSPSKLHTQDEHQNPSRAIRNPLRSLFYYRRYEGMA